ncbi:MAG TPA: hypothetical protein H9750_01255 [Candidatus Mediterraneibacter excrementavium]|nr:hypothetical protein [Candidatus Mediterraneibacter excrementavium]
MGRDDSIFAVKLYEMEEQYGKLRSRILACEQGGRERIRTVLKEACDEYRENELLLEEKARSSRSGAVAKLAEAQLDYRKKTGELLKGLAQDVHCEENTPAQDKEEADLLYAEYAMDFATLAMQQALISALDALDRQQPE